MIRGIKFVSIPVADQERALAFYTETLGFRLLVDQPFDGKQRWIELAIPGADSRVVLFRMDAGPQPGGMMNLTFWTDDVEATHRDLNAKGVVFSAPPQTAPWGTFAIFQDLDGNRFVLATK